MISSKFIGQLMQLQAQHENLEVVVGDPDTGRYFEPSEMLKPQLLWMYETTNGQDVVREYFDDEKLAQRERARALEGKWAPSEIWQVLCLKL